MKKQKAVSGLLMAACILSACGSPEAGPQLLREWVVQADAEATDMQEQDRVYRVAMVTDIGGVDDQGFNQSAWEGLEALKEATGTAVSYVESQAVEDFVPNFSELAENGYTLCWGVGYQCADALLAVAEKYPEINFAIIDNAYEKTPENVTAVVFRAQEPSFVVGYIAACVTKTNSVGFVGGIPSDIIDQFQYGYEAGVAYANHLFHKNVEVSVEYVGNFYDSAAGEQIADAMYGDGCDVVYAAAGGAGLGVIGSARKTGNYVIGVDRDQAYLAPQHVLTSGMKKVDVAILRVSQDYEQGRPIGGKTLSFGMAEGAVGIPENHENYSDEIYDAAIGLCDEIKAGKLVPPANEEEYKAFVSGL